MKIGLTIVYAAVIAILAFVIGYVVASNPMFWPFVSLLILMIAWGTFDLYYLWKK